jgi:GGDEF domain-containing protein
MTSATAPVLYKDHDQLMVRIAQVTSQHVGDDFFSKLCATLVEVFGAELAFVTRAKNTPTTRVKVLSQCATTALRVPEEFDLEGTPCELLYDGQGHIVPAGVQRDFAAEKDNGLESFIGIPLIDSTLGIIGHLSVYSVRPIQPEPRMLDVIKVFANRSTTEIQRLLVEEERDRLLDRLEAAYTALRQVSTIDPESGALTRKHLDEITPPLMAQGPVALTLLRVDGLEAQRALFGHVFAGDALRLTADTMQKLLTPETQPLARVADSYFAVLQKGANDDDAVLLAERLATAVEETILPTPLGQITTLTVSAIGASPRPGENWVQFFGRALQALDAIDKSATAEIQLAA